MINILENLKLFLYVIGFTKKCLCGGKIITIPTYDGCNDGYEIWCQKCNQFYRED